MKHDDLILFLLRLYPDLDDDELSKLSGVGTRQKVKQICRQLENCGKVIRERGAQGKIVNRRLAVNN